MESRVEIDRLKSELQAAHDQMGEIIESMNATRIECNRYWIALTTISGMGTVDETTAAHWLTLQKIAREALFGKEGTTGD